MKHLLLLTDFSDNAWNAIDYGIKLHKKTSCTFYILHVVSITNFNEAELKLMAGTEAIEELLLKNAREKLAEVMHKIEQLPLNTKHNFKPYALHGFFLETIRKEISEKDIDLIIMGTKGATGLKKLTLGSNTGNVITTVKCPVLAIPKKADYAKPKEIAFPTDHHLGYEIDILDDLIQMVKQHTASLRILYISKKDEKLSTTQHMNMEFLGNYFEEIDHSFHSVTGIKLETAVQCFVESRDIDMLVMVAKNLNFLQRILFTPSVEEISYHINVPFLVLHEQEAKAVHT